MINNSKEIDRKVESCTIGFYIGLVRRKLKSTQNMFSEPKAEKRLMTKCEIHGDNYK